MGYGWVLVGVQDQLLMACRLVAGVAHVKTARAAVTALSSNLVNTPLSVARPWACGLVEVVSGEKRGGETELDLLHLQVTESDFTGLIRHPDPPHRAIGTHCRPRSPG